MKISEESLQNIIVRPYKPSDYDGVKRNLEEGGLFDAEMDSKDRYKEKIERGPKSILVAEIDEKVIGSILFIEDGWGGFAFRLAVRKNYRQRGIGTKLMETVENTLKKKGYPEIHILVHETETALKNYYSKRGYQEGNLYRWMYKDLRKHKT